MYYRSKNRRNYGYSFERAPVEDKKGNLYYVRLKTPLGPFYKLGFTTMPSVRERFAFQNNGHEDQIDWVIGFIESSNALSIEMMLHTHFRRKTPFPRPEKGMPFFGNGQSELYAEDILGMDEDYTANQASCVHAKIMEARMRHSGDSDATIEKAINEKSDFDKDFANIIAVGSLWPINWLIRCWLKVEALLFTNNSEKEQEATVQERIRWFKEEVEQNRLSQDQARQLRAIQQVELNKLLRVNLHRH